MPKILMSIVFSSLLSFFCPINALHNKCELYPSKCQKTYFLNLHCGPVGMFSTVMSVLGALKEYELGRFTGVLINFGSGGHPGTYYDPSIGPNWWEYYFEPIYEGSEQGAHIATTVNGPNGYDFAGLIEFRTHRNEAHQLLKKYIKVKPHIKTIVNTFVNENFRNMTVIGIHYRGTDKISEAPRAEYRAMVAHLEEVRAELNVKEFLIFVATDEKAFLEFIKAKYPNRVIYYNSIRSSGKRPVHLSSKENYKKGEDAIVDCILLSKCTYLIKTSSNLSMISTFFNPKLPVVHVTKRY